MEERRFEIGAAPDVAQQVRHRKSTGLFEQPADGQGAGRVGELRLAAGKPAEPRLQAAKWHRATRLRHGCLCPLDVGRFERGGQALVQPGGNAAGRQRPHEGVRVFVSEHAVELFRVLERSAHRHPDDAVEGAGRPCRRPCDVVKLLGCVEHD